MSMMAAIEDCLALIAESRWSPKYSTDESEFLISVIKHWVFRGWVNVEGLLLATISMLTSSSLDCFPEIIYSHEFIRISKEK